MTELCDESLEISVNLIRRGDSRAGGEDVRIDSSRGEIQLRYLAAPSATAALICLGGADGGWGGPAAGHLFPRLCASLADRGVAALRVRYRQPGSLEECVLDVLAAAHFLSLEGIERVAVAGHGFGGAVAAQAAANLPSARALITLGTQAEGLEAVGSLPTDCASLFIHGAEDRVLTPAASKEAYRRAREPRYLRIFGNAGHGLDEVAEPLRRELQDWLLGELDAHAEVG